MHYVTSDIDISQMQKANGWSDYIYKYGLHSGRLGVWRSVSGFDNMVTTSGTTKWEGSDLYLTSKGSSATITPYGGDAVIQYAKMQRKRQCKKYPIRGTKCESWGAWTTLSVDEATVKAGSSFQVQLDQEKLETCSTNKLGVSECTDHDKKMKVSLLKFTAHSSGDTGGGGGGGDGGGGADPGAGITDPPPNPPPPNPPYVPSPPAVPPMLQQQLPLLLGIGAVAIIGYAVVKGLSKKAPAATPSGGM